MKTRSLVDAGLSFYPAWWRDVYGDEIRTVTEDLMAEGRGEWSLAADLLRGAVSVRLNGTAMPPQRELWSARTRLSIAVATLPWLVMLPFVLAATGGRSGYLYLTAATLSDPATRVSTYSSELLQTLLIVSFFAAAIGWCKLVGGVRRSSMSRDTILMRLSFVPLVSFLAVFGLFIARLTQLPSAFSEHGSGPPIALNGDPFAAHVLLVVLWFVLVAGAIASALSLAAVARRVDLPMVLLRSGRRTASWTAFTLTVMAIAAITGAIAATFQGHDVPAAGNLFYRGHLWSGQTLVVTPQWLLLITPLVVAAAVSVAGWRSARRAWRMTVFFD